jgi:hypothetical protein
MLSSAIIRQPRWKRKHAVVRTLSARAIWSRFASARAELIGSPSLSRPNLFAGD